jgi:hypothetical protein
MIVFVVENDIKKTKEVKSEVAALVMSEIAPLVLSGG